MSAIDDIRFELENNANFDELPTEKQFILDKLDEVSVTVETTAVKLTADTAMLGSGDTIPFNAIYYDDDGYWDNTDNKFIIPTGKEGVFAFGCEISVAANGGITSCNVTIENSGAFPNANIPILRDSAIYKGNGSVVLKLFDADELQCRFFCNIGATVKGGFSTTFWLSRLGDL
jgi:hypothetical protein